MNYYHNSNRINWREIESRYSLEFRRDLRQVIKTLKSKNNARINVLITESLQETQVFTREMGLMNYTPCMDEYVLIEGKHWHRRVYTYNNEGNSLILYSNTPPDNEKHTE